AANFFDGPKHKLLINLTEAAITVRNPPQAIVSGARLVAPVACLIHILHISLTQHTNRMVTIVGNVPDHPIPCSEADIAVTVDIADLLLIENNEVRVNICPDFLDISRRVRLIELSFAVG